MKLTTAAYRRPSGKNIHRFPDSKDSDEWGVMPDAGYDLRLSDHEQGLLLADRQQRDILRPHPAAERHATGPGGQPAAATTPRCCRAVPAAGPSPASATAGSAAAKAAGRGRAAGSRRREKSPASPPPRTIAAAGPTAPASSIANCRWPVKYLTDQLAGARSKACITQPGATS